MKISLKDLKAAIYYLEKNSDNDSINLTIGNECNFITSDPSGSEIHIILFQINSNGEASFMAKVKRTELLPFK